MKKTILLSSILAVSATFAAKEVDSDNEIAALSVGVGKDAPQLVTVPFAGYDGGDIKVDEMIKSYGLGKGTKLYVATGDGSYNSWTLADDGTWTPDYKYTVGTDGKLVATTTMTAGEVKIARGHSFWIQPVNAGQVIMLGQKPTGSASVDLASDNWNLVGNPTLSEITISMTMFSGAQRGDQLVVPRADGTLVYHTLRAANGLGWSNVTIPAGKGFWLKTKSAKINL